MTGSLRALLAGCIDYAGMFPPAGLPLARSLDEYRRHRQSTAAWMLGRFVVPAAKLTELAAIYDAERDGRLTAIVPAGDSGESFLQHLDTSLTSVARFPVAGAVDSLEFRWPVESLLEPDPARLANVVQTVAGQIAASRIEPITMFFELPRRESRPGESTGRELLRTAIAALADYSATAGALNCRAGFKLRCGGTNSAEIPSPAEVAAAICERRNRGVFWKATAGLHHPLRHIDPALHVPVHGFLNLLAAAVMADIHRLDERQTQAIIEEEDERQFGFSDDALVWREHVVTTEQIAAARERSLRSFGSCSFDEPCQDLKTLGML